MILEAPSEDAYSHGAQFTVSEAEYVETDLALWKSTLAEGYPIAFVLNTFDSFDEASRRKGKVPMPRQKDKVRETHGWHAMLCVGYSERDQMFIVRNSWGEDWGDQGYCYIPYNYVMNEDLNGHDSWIIKSVSDLAFDKDIWVEEDSSYLTQDDALVLYDFYIVTEDTEAFASALAGLCQDYCQSEEEYYFDYELANDDCTYIYNFEILTDNPEGFLDNLTALCEEYALEGDYDFFVEGEEDGLEEED
ncbi:MAG: hypothetical protein OHK0053_20350 [Microscillaceae bacterium]